MCRFAKVPTPAPSTLRAAAEVVVSLVSLFKRNGPSGFGYGSTADQVVEGLDLKGRTVLVTGCTSGIGLETVRALGRRGARVVGLARTEAGAAEALRSAEGSDHVPVVCELSEPSSVRAAVEGVRSRTDALDAVICNAGIMALPKLEQKYGYELQFFTNHVGHFLLVTGLLPHVAEKGRVVMVSSEAHRMAPKEGITFDDLAGTRSYEAWQRYGQSKLANLLFARALARKWAGTGKTANAVHPGVILTNLGRHMSPLFRAAWGVGAPLFMKSAPQGAATQTYVAVHPGAAEVTGAYWADVNVSTSSRVAEDPALADRLWAETERIVAALP